ncbi:hypothetical protein BDD43_2222 [Mucilaginibacter gracilis]|uniref:Uncharacterized protein n=1 Tax=Mucilaginibacter gracilis TaxID=423350 RepID=A0A495IZB4_9SPHI|nr:hypothetical protein BDD43_2222 [Mucilaginibacter gracilis]
MAKLIKITHNLFMEKFMKLSRVEMKNVLGGNMSDVCDDECGDGDSCKISTDTCTQVHSSYCTNPDYVWICVPAAL